MTINILKIGGGAGVNHANVLQNLAERVADGEQWVVVHGVSQRANQLAEQAGYTVRTITSPGGYVSRYTDVRMIEIYEQAVQDVNQSMVAELENAGLPTQSFATAGVVSGERKTAIRAIRNGRQMIVRDDYSGRITNIDQAALFNALNAGEIPVIAPIALGLAGESLNVDGDLVAAEIAHALNADTLVILSNVPGLLRDVNDANSLISHINLAQLDQFADYAEGRMKKKLIAAETAYVQRVILGDSRLDTPLDAVLNGAGTHIEQAVLHV